MKLYKVPKNSRVKVIHSEEPPPGGIASIDGEEYNFHHIDGMYSYCANNRGEVVHLKAWTEVEIVNG